MFILFTLSLALFLIMVLGLLLNWGYILSFNLFSLGSWNWLVNFSLDKVSLSVLVMLIICFFYAYFYTSHYFCHEDISLGLLKIITLFVVVMGILIFTNDYLTTLIFWEYLGVVSFFLILFYDNYLSLRSSVITLVSSRFGDVCLFLLIGLSCYNYNSMVLGLVYFFFILFSKSAGFPFISWLLEAMRAPTPVSSLVHSSTLVAAGIWFIMRYDLFNFFNDIIYFSNLLLISIFITGISSMFFLDLKKIIALSTCNNICWCVLYLIYGNVLLSLFQLISHGVSKCILFMLVGDVMSGSSGSQASNYVYSTRFYGNWNLFSLVVVILGLSGLPFIGVFFTKHYLLSMLLGVINICSFIMILVCMFLSYLYSFRLCIVLTNLKVSNSLGVLFSYESGLITSGWLFVNFFTFFMLDESVGVDFLLSINLLLVQIISLILSWLVYDSIIFSNWSSSLFGCDNLVEMFYSGFYYIMSYFSLLSLRWDNLMVCLFYNLGRNNVLSIFNSVLLNVLVLSSVSFILFLIIM
uniref:NADH:ubiquinone reductase (H(+)-translocating) n=1 Tax=Hydatigera krepkogorski TaxID=1434709 RepID=N0DQY5_9CEST|nr:NADH dehydrogenase subunit 5 [Hydatigera krepkogorski]BAN15677.1 NADH dehydrogenase subunit 5 [Hydatigera krepkogorski]